MRYTRGNQCKLTKCLTLSKRIQYPKGSTDYLNSIEKTLERMNPKSEVKHILKVCEWWEDRKKGYIQLHAATSIPSPMCVKVLHTYYPGKYEGDPNVPMQLQRGAQELGYDIMSIAMELAKKAFNCNYAEVRCVSGTLANLTGYYALTEPGDTIMSLSLGGGGHLSYREWGAAGCRGLKVVDIPRKKEVFEIDINKFRKSAKKEKPKLRREGILRQGRSGSQREIS